MKIDNFTAHEAHMNSENAYRDIIINNMENAGDEALGVLNFIFDQIEQQSKKSNICSCSYIYYYNYHSYNYKSNELKIISRYLNDICGYKTTDPEFGCSINGVLYSPTSMTISW